MKINILIFGSLLFISTSVTKCSNKNDDCDCHLKSRDVILDEKQLNDLGLLPPLKTQKYVESKLGPLNLKEIYEFNKDCPWLFIVLGIDKYIITDISFQSLIRNDKQYYKQFEKLFVGDTISLEDFPFIKNKSPGYSFRIPLGDCPSE